MNSSKCPGPVMALFMVRMGVGIFFLGFGLIKLFVSGPEGVTGMMAGLFGVSGAIAQLLAWIVIITELGGGLAVILGKLVPRIIYQLAIWGFVTINIVGFMSANWLKNESGFDIMQFLWHLMLLMVLVGLLLVGPKSPCGIIGDNTVGDDGKA